MSAEIRQRLAGMVRRAIGGTFDAVIKIDGGTQARVSLNQDVVKEYAESMREGDVFPPITVFFDGSDYWLADGFHRYFATKANAFTSIEAEVKNGTLDDATLFAFSANSKRGLSMTFEDNRNIIYAMLRHPEWSKWTNRTYRTAR